MTSPRFNSLGVDVAERFGLSTDKMQQLLGVLTALIFDEKRGGFTGFVNLFKQKGMGNLAQSWIDEGINGSISSSQVESLFGLPLIGAIAGKLGVHPSVASGAISGLLPDLVNELAVGGKEPTSVPEVLKVWRTGIAGWLDDFTSLGWTALVGAGVAMTGGARAVDRAGEKAVKKADGSKIAPWLMLGILLFITFLLFKSCKKEEAVTPAVGTGATSTSPAPVVKANSRFSFENLDGRAIVKGQVSSDVEKVKMWDALKATFGERNVDGDITVDANTAPAAWMDKLILLLPDLKAKSLKLGFDGDKLHIDTSNLSEAERFALSSKLRSAFDNFEISGLWDKALAALASLRPGFSTDELVKALNLSSITFATDSATITRDSYEILLKAAEAIKAAPAGTKIEVAGHTDNTGDAEHNLQRSIDRANAVNTKLVEMGVNGAMLVSKGYGQDNPVADNATEEGRAQNRRIEFTVSK